MANERETEDAVDALLHEHGYYSDDSTCSVEKQQSTIVAIRTALSKAGKAGQGGVGRPEFIITSPDAPDIAIIIECKAKISARPPCRLCRRWSGHTVLP